MEGRIGRLEFLLRYLIILLPLVAVHYLWCLDHKSCVSADGVLSGCTGIRGVPFQDIAHILGYGVMALALARFRLRVLFRVDKARA